VPELARATAAVVPVRFGGGTRVKILEAFAHCVPVVTTTVGCEGIEVEPGRHLLIGDDAATFADACTRLLGDPALRARLAADGATLFEDRYRAERVRDTDAALASSVMATAPGAPR
jgi:glycosyltransferase involved in cell wall biosynthesis